MVIINKKVINSKEVLRERLNFLKINLIKNFNFMEAMKENKKNLIPLNKILYKENKKNKNLIMLTLEIIAQVFLNFQLMKVQKEKLAKFLGERLTLDKFLL